MGVDLFGVQQSMRYVAKLYAAFEELAHFPRMARERSEFDPPIRVHPVGSHIVIYRIEDEGILVLRVRHGREDWQED